MDDDFEEMPLWDGWSPDPTLHEYDQHIQHLLRTFAECDAREWFSNASTSVRRLFEFSQTETDRIVDSVYARGANDVRVLGDEETILNGGSVDMLLIALPVDTDSRKQLFELCEMVAEECGFMEDVDEGQKYMLLRWT
ncbi:MAG TPA: hypothetical protein VMM76_04600 [Pirellulaceae bacterium]|nr:hypothetical protein [Pirellulaceae bacterium]